MRGGSQSVVAGRDGVRVSYGELRRRVRQVRIKGEHVTLNVYETLRETPPEHRIKVGCDMYVCNLTFDQTVALAQRIQALVDLEVANAPLRAAGLLVAYP